MDDRRRVTLSFDNGPARGVTEEVLDTLGERSMPATFFVVGTSLREPGARQLVERAHAEGHWIGNHGLTHEIQLVDLDEEGVAREIDGAQALLDDLAHPDKFFRPFGGGGIIDERLLGRRAVTHLRRGRYTCVLWNCVPRDWEAPVQWPEAALADINARPWSLVVLHDLPTGAMAQLPSFLDRLAAEGVEVVREFPPECVPLCRGEPTGELARLLDGDRVSGS